MSIEYTFNRDCPVHNKRRYENFCKECDKPLCPRCIMEHPKGHELVDFNDVLQNATDIMNTALKELGDGATALHMAIQNKVPIAAQSQTTAAMALVDSHVRLKEALAYASEEALVNELFTLKCEPQLVNDLKLLNEATIEQEAAAALCKCQPLPDIQWLQFTEALELVRQTMKLANQKQVKVEDVTGEYGACSSKMQGKYSSTLLEIQIAAHERSSEGAKWKLNNPANNNSATAQRVDITTAATVSSDPPANQIRSATLNTGAATCSQIVRTIHAYKAAQWDELSFDENDLLEVVGRDQELGDDWLIAKTLMGGPGNETKTGLVAKCYTIDITEQFMSNRKQALISLELAHDQELQRQAVLNDAVLRSKGFAQQLREWIVLLRQHNQLPAFTRQPWHPENVTSNEILESCVRLLQTPKLDVSISNLKAPARAPRPQPPCTALPYEGQFHSVIDTSHCLAPLDKNKTSFEIFSISALPDSDSLIVADFDNRSIKRLCVGHPAHTLLALTAQAHPSEVLLLAENRPSAACKRPGEQPYRLLFLEYNDSTKNRNLCLATTSSTAGSAVCNEVARIQLEQKCNRQVGSLCQQSATRFLVAFSGFRSLERFELNNASDSSAFKRLAQLAFPNLDSPLECFTLTNTGERELIIACFQDLKMRSFAFTGASQSSLEFLALINVSLWRPHIWWDASRQVLLVPEYMRKDSTYERELNEYEVESQSGRLNRRRTLIPKESGRNILAMCVWKALDGTALFDYSKKEILLLK